MSGTLIIIKPDGTKSSEPFEGKGYPPLEQLQSAVGGYIERVRVRWAGKLRDGFVNEDGLMLKLQYNPHARLLTTHTIVGNLAIWVPAGNPKHKPTVKP